MKTQYYCFHYFNNHKKPRRGLISIPPGKPPSTGLAQATGTLKNAGRQKKILPFGKKFVFLQDVMLC